MEIPHPLWVPGSTPDHPIARNYFSSLWSEFLSAHFSDFSRVLQKAILPAFLLSLRIAGGIIWNLQLQSYHLTTLMLRLSLYLQRLFFFKKNAKQYLPCTLQLTVWNKGTQSFSSCSYSREVKAAGWIPQGTKLRLVFSAAFLSKSANLYILKIWVPLVENCWSKLLFTHQKILSPSPSDNKVSFNIRQSKQTSGHQ